MNLKQRETIFFFFYITCIFFFPQNETRRGRTWFQFLNYIKVHIKWWEWQRMWKKKSIQQNRGKWIAFKITGRSLLTVSLNPLYFYQSWIDTGHLLTRGFKQFFETQMNRTHIVCVNVYDGTIIGWISAHFIENVTTLNKKKTEMARKMSQWLWPLCQCVLVFVLWTRTNP